MPHFEETFSSETIKREDGKTIAWFSALAEIKKTHGSSTSPWLFGSDFGTVLDAQALLFLRRLQDVGLEDFVPPSILAYGQEIMNKSMWQNFMQGRNTMYVPLRAVNSQTQSYIRVSADKTL
jgi:hypothetical protein